MVDFNKQLSDNKAAAKPVDPAEIYESADRASDTGPLRPAQVAVLRAWFDERRQLKDLIIKMHTGQGKTLIGLLILQSKLNETGEPAVYICPNNNLVQQTLGQAKRFGIPCCTAEKDIPEAFTDAEQILVTTVQKLFNGLTKFRLGPHSLPVGALVMDDCHACIDSIQAGMKITVPRNHAAYQALLALFASDLKEQGSGTYAEIEQGDYGSFLSVPYWSWTAHQNSIAALLAKHAKTDEVKYAWPLVKDTLQHCTCIVSGASIEIDPHLPPLEHFGSYANAKHRVFMSATVTNDAFLVKGLGLSAATITGPLVDKHERWSGEKMILLPSLIHATLDRRFVVSVFAKAVKGRTFGAVAITPSFKVAKEWQDAGAKCAKPDTIDALIEGLRNGHCEETIVIANRYDGIDLPDNACRILIIDSKPQGESLSERLDEVCRGDSQFSLIKMARSIEQGLGRSVRGEKDYSVIIITGSDLVKRLRAKKTRGYFSEQTQTQIGVGLDIAELAKGDVTGGKTPGAAFYELMGQCLKRDEGWKKFYSQRMAKISGNPATAAALDIFASEYAAELAFQSNKPEKAVKILQDMVDSKNIVGAESGWYLQEMARYSYGMHKDRSNELQVAANQRNRYLLKPRQGLKFETISIKGQKRLERMIAWLKEFGSPEEMLIEIDAVLSDLRFGVTADDFEKAFDEVGKALGFVTQRPDKELGEGPDNLWALKDDVYWLVECKNQVDPNRKEINKQETGQLNNSCAWFRQHYPSAKKHSQMIIWTKKVSSAAGFNDPVRIMTNKKLEHFVRSIRGFFEDLKGVDLQDLSEVKLQKNIESHGLTVEELIHTYSEEPVQQ